MTGLHARLRPAESTFVLALVIFVCDAWAGVSPPSKAQTPTTLLLEARHAASSIQETAERSAALDPIVVAQIAIDPSGARETLKIFPNLPRKLTYFTALAAAYAQSGNIPETERMYAEIVVEDQSSRAGKLAAVNALGELAIAYANSGNIEEAFRTLARLKERVKDQPPPIMGMVIAKLAEAQAKKGDIRGAVQTASSIAGENPLPLMKIVGGQFRSGKVKEAQDIVSRLDDASQRYAQWGIVQVEIEQGRFTDAQVRASAIKPGHAKASALLELATYRLQHGTTSLALLLLQEAETSARLTVNEWTRADILWHIAAAMALAGDTASAVGIARGIEKEGQRRSAIYDIAKAQALLGDLPGAFNTATMLKTSARTDALGMSVYEMAISDILVEMVKSGKGKEATATAAHFQDPDVRRAWLYSGIAMAQADAGNIKEAKAVLALAESDGQRNARRKELVQAKERIRLGQNPADATRQQELLKMEIEIQRALDAIAKALARKGDLRSGIAIVNELTESAHRLDIVKEVSAVHARAGYKEHTLQWARNLSDPSEKAFALVGIATALSHETDKRKAKVPTVKKER